MSNKEGKSVGETSTETHSATDQNQGGSYATFNKKTRKQVILVIQIIIFVVGVACCAASLSVKHLKSLSYMDLQMWQWCFLITALLGGPLLSRTISYLILLSINREYFAKENFIYYVVGLVESAWVTLWFGTILLAWIWVIKEPRYLGVEKHNRTSHRVKSTVTLTLVTIILGSFLWLIKTLIIMILKSSFHIRRFFGRITESLAHEYRIKVLSGGNHKLQFRNGDTNFCGNPKEFEFELSKLKNVGKRNVSCWMMKILIQDIIKGRSLVYMDDNKEENIDKEEKIREAAQKIFSKLVPVDHRAPHHTAPITSKIEYRLSSSQMEEIEKALKKSFGDEEAQNVKKWLLEGDRFDEEVCEKSVRSAWNFRRALVSALQDNKQLFHKLDRGVDVVLVIIIFIVWLVMLKVEVRRALVVVGSAIVGSAFILKDLCRDFLNDFTFVFVAHPFDVGDCCEIGGTTVIIEHINLLTTKAITLENEQRYYPNRKLRDISIGNYTRSPFSMGEEVMFYLNIGAPEDKISMLERLIESYIQENPQYWDPHHMLMTEFDSEYPTKMRAILRVNHTINYHEFKEAQVRKSKLIAKLRKYLKALDLVPTTSIHDKVGRNKWIQHRHTSHESFM